MIWFRNGVRAKTKAKVLIVIGVLPLAVFLGLRLLLLGRFTLPSEAEFEAIAKDGQPLAQAICDYRAEKGLCPLEISDLVPRYLPKVPESGWRFDRGELSHNAGIPRSIVRYAFVGKEDWFVFGEGINAHKLKVAGPVSHKPTLTGEALFNAQLAEYERRINRYPDYGQYRDKIKDFCGDKINFLGLAKRQDLLRPECERFAKRFPDWCLPQIALAWLDELGSHSEKQFVSWVGQHRTFANYWYLARYYRNKGDIPSALTELELAGASPFEEYPPDSIRWAGSAFAFDAVKFSYEANNYELTIKLCNHCESKPGSWGGCTLLEFKAAAELKLLQFDSAINDAQQVVTIASQEPMSVFIDPRNLSRLLEAANAHDTNFLYHPGGDENFEWSPFVEPSP